MARFESKSVNRPRFWEIAVHGNRLQTRYGRIGTDGREGELRVFDSAQKAQKEAKKRMTSKEKSGFARVDDDVSDQFANSDFVTAIVRGNDAADRAARAGAILPTIGSIDSIDPEPYLVYGDWLHSQGDPRAELIAVQSRLSGPARDAAQADILAKHRFLPSRLDHMIQRGRRQSGPGGETPTGACQVEWKFGFVHWARIGRSSNRPPYTVRELCAALFAHPSAQVLSCLTIGPLGPTGNYDYQPVVSEIARAAPLSLRDLVIAEFDADHTELAGSQLGDVGCLGHRLDALRRLHLRAGSMDVDGLNLPALRQLGLTSVVLQPAVLAAMARTRWPELAVVEVEVTGSPLPPGDVEALLSSQVLPALRYLACRGTDETGQLWRAIAGSDRASSLERLDLSGGALTDRDADHLLTGRQAFPRLVEIDLSGNLLSADAISSLAHGFADAGVQVRAAAQRVAAPGTLTVSEQEIYQFAPDVKSMTAARRIASPQHWPEVGRQDAILWGRCRGSDLYDVCVDIDALESECSCPSMKYPCKHAVALLLLARRQTLDDQPAPAGFTSNVLMRL
ncbi:MAG: WGR domain-containing protein [Proteobacteria bacterium]|nr:WGR domain-containing protein [Pseudomonadota bacterium]